MGPYDKLEDLQIANLLCINNKTPPPLVALSKRTTL